MKSGFLKSEIVRTENCANRIYDQHCHPYYEVLFVIKGSVLLNIEGSTAPLYENTGIVIEPLKYHIVTGNQTDYHRLILLFEECDIPEGIRTLFADNARINSVFASSGLTDLFQKYIAVLEKDNSAYYPLQNAIFTEILYALSLEERNPASLSENKAGNRLKRIIDYVDQNLSGEIHLSDIATALYMSESAVCHLFKEEMKTSLKKYIIEKKMMYARSLLQQGATPGSAAIACGYKNYASFYKMFCKIVGKSPAEILSTQ